MKVTIILLIVSIFLVNCLGNNENVIKNQLPIKTLGQIFVSFKQIFFGNNSKQTIEKCLLEMNVNSKCSQSLRKLVTKPYEEWVLRILESSGRLPIGLMSGTTTSFGDYDQCLATMGRLDDNTPIRGKYCFLNIGLPLQPKALKVDPKFNRISNGICIPSLCSQTEITQLLRNVLSELQLNITVEHCSEETDKISLNWPQMMAIAWILFSIIAVIIGTIFELSCSNLTSTENQSEDNKISKTISKNKIKDLFVCYSLLTNAKRVLSITEQNTDRNELRFLQGIQVLSMLWSITSHLVFRSPMSFYDMPILEARWMTDGQNYNRSFFAQFIFSATLHVQTSFIISGLLSLHTSFKFKKDLKYLPFVLHRYLRFTPMLFALFCCQLVWPLLGSGPLFHNDFIQHNVGPCYRNWLPSFLFLSNWLPVTEQCCVHTWYLSADFQINLFSYFLIIYYIKNHSKAFKLNIILIIIATLIPTILNYIYKMTPIHPCDLDTEKLNYTFKTVEFNTYNHLMAYFIGTLLAAVINNKQQITIPRITKNVIWVIMMTALLITPFSLYLFIQTDQIPVTLLTISYTTIKRIVWAASISWIILACATFDKNSLFANFLSAKIFQPFSRLNFSIYLSHMLLIWYHSYQSRQLLLIGHSNTFFQMGGVVTLSLVLGFLFYILFEAPAVNLMKIIFADKTRVKSEKIKININEEKPKLN